MSKYITFRVKLPTGTIVEIMAKDTIEALAQAADFYEVDYDDLTLV